MAREPEILPFSGTLSPEELISAGCIGRLYGAPFRDNANGS